MALIDKLKKLADVIREKTGTTEEMTLDQMAKKVSKITSGEGGMKQLIERTITEVYSASATSIGQYAFYRYINLTSVDFPMVTSIDQDAFSGCSNLTSINLPLLTSIKEKAFYNCSKLTNIDFPLVTSIGWDSFDGCSNLTSINLPLLTKISQNAFVYCDNLKNVTFPSATWVDGYAFSGCTNLVSADLPFVTRISRYAFLNCKRLTRIILRSKILCKLDNINAFENCYHFHGTVNNTYNPTGAKDGYIYVPRDLIEDYKVATNWATFADRFRALEDYTVDGTTTGELDNSKI